MRTATEAPTRMPDTTILETYDEWVDAHAPSRASRSRRSTFLFGGLASKTDGSQGDEIGNHIGERVDGLLPSFCG